MIQDEEERKVKERGVQAIIYLQKFAGITETEETATRGWRSLSEHERASTLAAYEVLSKKGNSA